MKLKDIAEIQSGLVLERKKAKTKDEVNMTYKSLNLKSLDESGFVDNSLLDNFNSIEKLDKKYITSEGNMIMRLSSPYTVIAITKQLTGYVLPSNFVKIILNSNIFLSEFLALYLNSEAINKKLKNISFGSAVSIIKTSNIEEIEIKSIPLEKQEKLISLNKLHMKEQLLLKKQLVEKQKFFKGILNKNIK
jgi:restriction endonuclease S subunit